MGPKRKAGESYGLRRITKTIIKTNMKKLLIAILMLLLGGGGYVATERLGWGNTPSATYITKAPTQATTTVQGCRRSLYYSNWVCATTTGVGHIPVVVGANTGRKNLEICVPDDDTDDTALRIWLANSSTTAMHASSSNSTGILIKPGMANCWNMLDYGIIWPGKVLGLASTSDAAAQGGNGSSSALYIDYSE